MVNAIVFGGTGELGSQIVLALRKAGHETTVLVRDATPSNDPAKQAKLADFDSKGVKIVEGDVATLPDDELVALLRRHGAVISTLGGQALGPQQLRLIEAAKQAGTIKRFLPSEFGVIIDAGLTYPDNLKFLFEPKEEVRQALRASGIPYTFVSSHAFMSYFAPGLGIIGAEAPSDPVRIHGSGDVPYSFATLEDIGAVTAKAIDDPGAANKHLDVRGDAKTQNELVALWEKLTGKQIGRQTVTPEQLDKEIADLVAAGDIRASVGRALEKTLWINTATANASTVADPDRLVATSELSPDFRFTTVEEFLTPLAQKAVAA